MGFNLSKLFFKKKYEHSKHDVYTMLSAVPFFSSQVEKKNFFNTLNSQIEIKRYKRNHILQQRGNIVRDFCVIKSGRIKAHRNGRPYKIYKCGDYLNENALILPFVGKESLVCEEDCEILVLSRSGFRTIEEEFPNTVNNIRETIRNKMF